MGLIKLTSFVFLVVLSIPGWTQIRQAEFWSEGIFYSEASRVSSAVFARAFVPTGMILQPYFQMGQITAEGTNLSPDWYGASGMHWDLSPFRLFGEYRFHAQKRNDFEKEWRVLLVFGNFYQEAITRGSAISAFFEPYAEAAWTSVEQNQFGINLLPRGGFRYLWNSETVTDLFLEPALVVRGAKEIEQEFEMRPTGRVQYCSQRVCFSLAASQASQFRLLATLGGAL